MKNGATVQAFERAFAAYVGAKYGIACCNGTATLHTALVALGLDGKNETTGDQDVVMVPPLTMASTTLAVLHAGCRPMFVDVDPHTWLAHPVTDASIAVSLYGLHVPGACWVDDAAQTLRPHNTQALFTSYSFQSSKVLALGEGGMLTTDDDILAAKARTFVDLGYPPDAREHMKSPTAIRHTSIGWNYRMNDLTAAEGLKQLVRADFMLQRRQLAAAYYRDAHAGCSWLTPQHVPEGLTHDYWCYPLLVDFTRFGSHPFAKMVGQAAASHSLPSLGVELLQEVIVKHGGERPYGAWRITYQEPALRHLAPDGTCPVAESLQPRLLQFQTNDLASAEKNAKALKAAIQEMGG